MDNFLSSVPMFADLDADTLADLQDALQPVQLERGEFLFRQGQESDGMYLIKDGEICLEVRTPGDEVLKIATASSTDVVGEMALMDSGLRSASARAERDSQTYLITRDRFELLKSDLRPAGKALCKSLLLGFCGHCRRLVEDLSGGSVVVPQADKQNLDRDLYSGPAEWPCSLEVLRQFNVFKDFSDLQISQLMDQYQRLTIPRGIHLYQQGELADGLYVILRGALRSSVKTTNGELQIGVHGPGQIAGYMELIENHSRIVNLATRENSELLYISQQQFLALIDRRDSMAVRLLANLNNHAVSQLRKVNNTASRMASFEQFVI
jgi:CRP-like cAMP-binding protein